MRVKYLHIIAQDKFIPPFVSYVNKNFNADEHLFFFINNRSKIPIPEYFNVRSFNNIGNKWSMFRSLKELSKGSQRIFLHGLFKTDVIAFLFFNKGLLSKVYWMMWGGDVYFYQPRASFKEYIVNLMRISVIKKIQNFVTIFNGDYDYLDEKFKLKGTIHSSFTYESNIFKPIELPLRSSQKKLTVMIGNSASDSNDHEEIFTRLSQIENQKFEILCPLSYGNKKNKERVIKIGKKLFKDRFHALEKFIPLNEYNHLIANVDVVIFNHKRQQAVGNIVTLLGYGKKVYLQPETSHARFFKEQGFVIFDVAEINLTPISESESMKNTELAKKIFNYETYNRQLSRLFNL